MLFLSFLLFALAQLKSFWVDYGAVEDPIISQVGSSIITWYAEGDWSNVPPQPILKDRYEFIDEVQVFTATGGCYSGYPKCSSNRDLLKNPSMSNSTFDFTSMIKVVENIMKMGFQPYVVTGNVPISFSTKPEIGVFGVNSSPPDKVGFPHYLLYIQSFARSLVQNFGLDKVRKFRFGVLTEFNNYDWYKSDNTVEDYMKLYDFTESALSSIIGSEYLRIGAHACTQCHDHGGGWDPTLLIQHCATGKNYVTGHTGTRITFLADSFYESEPGKPGDLSQLDFNIQQLQKAVEKYGLGDLESYGIDEGRILSGPDGLPLTSREVGNSYQASFDALFFDKMCQNKISYYSRWNTNSQGLFGTDNVDTVASNVARVVRNMFGFERLKTHSLDEEKNDFSHNIIGLVPGKSENEIRMICYYHITALDLNELEESEKEDERIKIRIMHLPWKSVNVSVSRIDDQHAQYWPAWQDDIKNNNITKFISNWSRWSSTAQNTLTEKWEQDVFLKRLPVYQNLAKLKVNEVINKMDVKSDSLELEFDMIPHSVLYVSITKIE